MQDAVAQALDGVSSLFAYLTSPSRRIYLGLTLALLAVGLIAVGAGLQRYALDRISPLSRTCSCLSTRSLGWLFGLSVYFFANVLYTLALLYAPASLCATFMAMIVPLNALTSRCLLGERQQTGDVQGGGLIMVGIAIAAWAAPYTSEVLTAADIELLLLAPRSLAVLALLMGIALVLACLIFAFETQGQPLDETSSKSAGLAGTMPFAYPIVIGLLESLVQLFQKGGTQLLAQRLGGQAADGEEAEESHQLTTLVMLGGWALTSLLVVWWLRKGLGALPASRLLPIEYGTFTATSVLSGLVCYDEVRFVAEGHLRIMSGGMVLVLVGCAFVGSRRALRVRCTTDEAEEELRVSREGGLDLAASREALLPKATLRSDHHQTLGLAA